MGCPRAMLCAGLASAFPRREGWSHDGDQTTTALLAHDCCASAGRCEHYSGARAQDAERAFSFAAYGDSRPMMYLPYKQGQPELHRLLLDLFGLVLPRKVAEAVIKRDVKL